MQTTYDEAARTALLDKEIGNYAKRGYRVISRTPTTAQLLRPKTFSFLWCLFWIWTGCLVYIVWYLAKRDSQVYLTVDANGKVRRS